MHRKTVFQTGLRLITQELKSTNAVTMLILVGAGSRYEVKEINGLSHFLEHMFFKGALRYPDTRAVSAAIDSVGGDFNAFTGKEYAGYYVKVASKYMPLAMDVLSDMLINSKFAPEEIDKERQVILEEYNMYQDTPMYQVGWDFERLLFGDQPLGWDQVGSKSFIRSVTHEHFLKYKHDLYTADNVVISLAGNIDHAEAVSLTELYFTFDNRKKAYNFSPCEVSHQSEKIWLQNKKTEQAHLIIGFPAYSEIDPNHFALKVLSVILGGNMSSRMFLAIREKRGLTYYINTTTDDYQDVGVISTHAGIDINRIDDAIKYIIEEYLRIKDELVPEDELKKAKDFIKGKMILRLEDSEEYAHLLGKQELLHDNIKTAKEIMKEVDKVTRHDIKRICEDLFRKEKLKLAVIGPFEDKERFCRLLEV